MVLNGSQGQVTPLKRLQGGLGRRMVGRWFRMASRQSCHRCFGVSQVLACGELQQGQDPQSKRPPANEARYSLITLPIHGRKRQRFAFQPAKPTLDQVFFARRQDGLLKRQLLFGWIGGRHAPAQAVYRLLRRRVIHFPAHAQCSFTAYSRRAVPVGTYPAFFHLFFDRHCEHAGGPVLCEDGVDGLLQRGDVGGAFCALLVLIALSQRDVGPGQASLQRFARL